MRRTFLKTTAAAVAGAQVAYGESAGAAIRCGILGIDHAHGIDVLKVLRAMPEYELVGVCEPDSGIRAAFDNHPEMAGVPWVDRETLLDDPAVRMIAVESHTPRLLALGREVVDAGKHLHLDKPPGTSLAAFQALLDRAGERDVLVQMGYMFRYNAGFDLVRQAVEEGWLGKVYSIHASMCTNLGAEKRTTLDFHPGGVMLELGCHLIDMIVLLRGEPARVTSYRRHDGPFDDELADNTLAVLEYPWGMATVEVGAMEPHAFTGRRFRVVGTQGSLTVNPLEPPRARLALSAQAGPFDAGVHEVACEDRPRHVRDLHDLARAIHGETEFAYSRDHDAAVQRTVLRACGDDV